MTIRYISLHIDFDSCINESISSKFNLQSRFICNFLSTNIKKLKFQTDGTFNMISITPSNDIKYLCRIVGEKSLQARVSFDEEAFQTMNELETFEYYLKLLEEGYKICNSFKDIPLEYLLKLHQDFRNMNYRNEWLFKKKKFKAQKIEIILICDFTSVDFQLRVKVNNIENNENLIEGVLIRTLPHEVYFDKLFKDVVIKDDDIIITEYSNRPKFIFRIQDIYNRKFKFETLDIGLKYTPYLV